ncbi:MAG: hypothetical protein IJ494_08265 [Bacteroides sp.]|nr:hypothetical protein [Bacteroides sp.]
MKNIIISRFIFTGILLIIWYFGYPHTLLHYEETSFFANIPDYYHKYHSIPADIIKIAGNFIVQFYKYQGIAALLQTLWVVLFLIGCDLIIYRLLKNIHLLWVSFIPACYFAMQQGGEHLTVEYSLKWVISIYGILILLILLRRQPIFNFFSCKKALHLCNYLIPYICILSIAYNLLTNQERKHYEKLQRIEDAAMDRNWNKVLQEIPDDKENIGEIQLRYFLLALSETEQLGEYLFHFPINNSKYFYFDHQLHRVAFRFNSLFYWCLGIPNEAIRFAFQESQDGNSGDMSFGALRRMTDWYMQRGDIRQALFYLNILSYTTCHDTFIKTRKMFLQQSTKAQTNERPFFVNAQIPVTTAYLLEINPQHTQALNYLLCSFLLDKDLESFYNIFCTYWPKGKHIPAHYEEALLMLEDNSDITLDEIFITDNRRNQYKELKQLLEKGDIALINFKFRNTFWRYMLMEQQKENEVDGQTNASTQYKNSKKEITDTPIP